MQAGGIAAGARESGGPSAGGTQAGAGTTAAGGSPAGSVSFGGVHQGEGTYYAATGEGACMFDASPDNLDVAALNQPDWQGSALCGACADVQGPKGRLVIRIVDLCPGCKSGDLDFSEQAFAKIADVSAGRVPITWTLVPCEVTGPVRYRYKDGSNPYWTAVQVLNHRLPVTRLEWSTDGQTWNQTERTEYNYFLASGGFGTGPVRVRITAIDGQTLEDELPPVQELLVVTGQGQFR